MTNKGYYNTVSTVFLVVAIGHLLRIFNNWEAVVGGAIIPMWFSWVAVLLAGYLSTRGFSMASRARG